MLAEAVPFAPDTYVCENTREVLYSRKPVWYTEPTVDFHVMVVAVNLRTNTVQQERNHAGHSAVGRETCQGADSTHKL